MQHYVQCSTFNANYRLFKEYIAIIIRDRGGTVVKVLCYKSEGRWFDPSWCQWIFSLA